MIHLAFIALMINRIYSQWKFKQFLNMQYVFITYISKM
jgi:hypothetical protein